MKKRVLNISLILLMASTGSVFAQQGFGTNRPAQSAAVDIVSPNKGLLIPRMNLTWSTKIDAPITNPAQGLLVYNKTTVTNVPEGFYYFSAGEWHPIGISVLQSGTNTTVTGTGTANDPYKVNVTFPQGTVDTNTTTTVSNNQTYVTVDQAQTTGFAGDALNTRDYKVGVNKATANTLGVVMPGTGMTVDNDGKLNVTPVADVVTTITNTVVGHKIADYTNEAMATVAINETVTNLSQSTSGISYTNEAGTAQTAKVVSANSGNLVATGTDFGALLTKNNVQGAQVKYEVINGVNTTASLDAASTSDLQKYKVDVATATSGAVGVVKPGTGLNIATDGTLNVNFPTATVDTNTITTVVANTAQSYVSVTSTPATPGATANREYTVGVNAATANTLGVVKPGTGLTVDGTGILNVSVTDTNSKAVVTAANTNVVVTPNVNTTTDTTTYAVDVKNAMPKFFYMPSILIDTSVVDANAIKTVNLYTQYKSQFNVSIANMRSAGAPVQIPTLPLATDLYYYVTYSDAASIQITGIDANGEMSYRVLGNTNSLSFVNIVFVIK